ncbi:hypothetical protein [Streptomyces xanthochromogenes]
MAERASAGQQLVAGEQFGFGEQARGRLAGAVGRRLAAGAGVRVV